MAVLLAQVGSRHPKVTLYAAYNIAKLAHNPDLREALTDEGGLHAVLYLARCPDVAVQQDVVKALCNLSQSDVNKVCHV